MAASPALQSAKRDTAPAAAYERALFVVKVQLWIILLLMLVILGLSILTASLFPLKRTELVVYEFKDNSKNFVKIHAANQQLQANEALLDRFMQEYVENRETVDRMTESIRYKRVFAMNSSNENAKFRANYGGPSAPANQKGFNRSVEIQRTTRLAKNFYQVEFKTKDWWDVEEGKRAEPPVENEWVSTFEFRFDQQVVSKEEATFNPLGIFVNRYSLSKRT